MSETYHVHLKTDDPVVTKEADEHNYVQVPTTPSTGDSKHVMFRLKKAGEIVFETAVDNINYWETNNE